MQRERERENGHERSGEPLNGSLIIFIFRRGTSVTSDSISHEFRNMQLSFAGPNNALLSGLYAEDDHIPIKVKFSFERQEKYS